MAGDQTLINGRKYDWDSVEVQLPTGIAITISEITYSDEQALEPIYGKGSKPIGYGQGNYKATASIVLRLDEFESLKDELGGSLYKAEPFPIVISYGNDDMPTVTDTIPACKVIKTDTSSKQGETNVSTRKLDLSVLEPIQWGGKDAVE